MQALENLPGSDLTENQPDPLQARSLSFKRAFWIVTLFILVNQIFALTIRFLYGFDKEVFPSNYYLYLDLGGLFWYAAFLAFVVRDIKSHQMSPLQLFNADLTVLFRFFPQVLKYFSGCAVIVFLLSFFSKETELALEHQTKTAILISLFSTVIVAPVFEENIFRGYLYTAMLPTFKRVKERLVVNAMLFAAAHVFLVAFFLGAVIPYYIFVLGYFLAKLYEDSRSVLPGIWLHALNNGLVFFIDVSKLNGWLT
ncbi:MAG: lysostaphin resistance A-like protein [bacterium]